MARFEAADLDAPYPLGEEQKRRFRDDGFI